MKKALLLLVVLSALISCESNSKSKEQLIAGRTHKFWDVVKYPLSKFPPSFCLYFARDGEVRYYKYEDSNRNSNTRKIYKWDDVVFDIKWKFLSDDYFSFAETGYLINKLTADTLVLIDNNNDTLFCTKSYKPRGVNFAFALLNFYVPM